MTNPLLLDRHLKIQNSCKVHTQVQNNTDTHVEFKLMQLNFMHRINNKIFKCSPSLTARAATVCFSSEFNRNWAVWHHWNRVHKKDNLCKNACKTHNGPLHKKNKNKKTNHTSTLKNYTELTMYQSNTCNEVWEEPTMTSGKTHVHWTHLMSIRSHSIQGILHRKRN